MVMARRASPSLPAAALLLLLMQAVSGQRVKVIPEVTAYPGDEVSLRCSFVDPNGEVKKSQVTWIRDIYHEKKQNIAVYNPMFGESYPESSIKGRVSFRTSSLDDPTIVINPVKLEDEGSYICEYATYPSGNEEGVTKLYVLAKPVNYGDAIQVQEGPKSVPVARCVSSSGKPPAEISWISSFPGNVTTENQTNANGTVTVISTFSLVPSGLIHDYVVTCQVHHKTLVTPEKFNIKLNVNHSPVVSISGYDDNWYLGREGASLVCQSRANPPATSVTWKAANGKIPDSVQVNGDVLQVKKVDPSVNTTFICEVTNSVGVSQRELSVFVRESPPERQVDNAGVVAGAVIGSLLAIFVVGGVLAALFMCRRRQRNYREDHGTYDTKTRVFGAKNNGTGAGALSYKYCESSSEANTEKSSNNFHVPPLNYGVGVAPTAQDILLGQELDDVEKSKFSMLEYDENYDHFDENVNENRPVLQIQDHDCYLDDDMESQRDGSVISRTAVYV
ncbi:nectin-2 isoform X1 [Polypterus senegalus]|uniref:nectin-2 isoform X1 n=1 Tax=Polypterus senegalus TaxID=55291 RepID=UPI00196492CF|nr:nectin-2 isoform X1 [Polypterus senegalus]